MTCIAGSILFAGVEADARAALKRSALGGLACDEIVVDLFCGGGGFDQGAKQAGVMVTAAVNHSEAAIITHQANHPHCEHHRGDAWKVRPAAVIRGRRCGLLLASAACTTHSRARGAAPISPRVHMLGWCIARYLKEGRFRAFVVENVPEWQLWGPMKIVTDAAGQRVRVADKDRLGEHWRRWCRYVRRLGYTLEYRVIDGVDYGEASRRKRLFVMGRRDGAPIDWPERTHGTAKRERVGELAGGKRTGGVRHRGGVDEYGGGVEERDAARRAVSFAGAIRSGGADAAGGGAGSVSDGRHGQGGTFPHRTAAEIIDWSDLGHSIFLTAEEGKAAGCKRPLAPKSLERIARGIVREVLEDASPFVLRVTHGEGFGRKVWRVDGPMPTQTTRQDLAVVTPVLVGAGGAGYAGKPRRMDEPKGTVLPDDRSALISPLLAMVGHGEREGQAARVRRVDGPMNTVTAGNGTGEGLVTPMLCYLNRHTRATRPDEPMNAVLSGGGHAAMVAPFLVQYYTQGSASTRADKPLGCCTTVDRHGLVTVVIGGHEWVIVDVLFRMLRPHELAAAMGFPADYVWPRSQREATRMIGNAVQVKVAEAMVRSIFPRGRMQEREECAA